MFIVVPTGTSYTATVTQSAKHPYKCERCGQTFECTLFVQAQGSGSSPLWLRNEEAQDDAEIRAHQNLKRSWKRPNMLPAPCPSCGWYQSDMVHYHKDTIFPGVLVFCVSIFFIIILISLIFSIYLIGEDGWKAIPDIVTSKVLWIALMIPALPFGLVMLLRKLSNLNRSRPLFKRIKAPITNQP